MEDGERHEAIPIPIPIPIPVPVVLHIAQQILEDASPILSYTSRLLQLQKLRSLSKGIAEMMDVMIWPPFIMMHVREEYQTLGGPWSSVPPPDESLLTRMQDFAIMELYCKMCADAVTTQRTRSPHTERAVMIERILEVAERDWEWLPIKRELRARRTTWIKLRAAEDTYCLGNTLRTIPRANAMGGTGISREDAMDAAVEKWGKFEALEAHKAKQRMLADRRREAKAQRRRNLEGLGTILGSVLGDWTIDQLIYSNPTFGKVFKKYAYSPSARNLATASGVVCHLALVRARNIQMVNSWFVGPAATAAAADSEEEAKLLAIHPMPGSDVWRINRVGRTEQALLSVPAMKLIHMCEQQCGREDGPMPIMTRAIRHFASRLRAVRMLWTGSPETPIVKFPTQAPWVLRPTQQFLDATLVNGAEWTIGDLNAIHKMYVDASSLIQEYNARLNPDHVKYITDASMSRALLSLLDPPKTSWDILSKAMMFTHIDLCCTIVRTINTTGCLHVSEHLQEVIAASPCMNREAILHATCLRILECINGA